MSLLEINMLELEKSMLLLEINMLIFGEKYVATGD